MVSLTSGVFKFTAPGPLVDDGAPYSGLGIVELRALAGELLPRWNGSLDQIPESVRSTPYWQYGSGQHASAKRKILVSVVLSTSSDQGNRIDIRHLVIEGSSQWVIVGMSLGTATLGTWKQTAWCSRYLRQML